MTHLERVDTGAVHVYGDLVTPSGRRHPITLPPQDWEALEEVFAEPARIMELREAALRRVVEMHNDYVKTLLRERDTAERQRDAMRPVVEAARALLRLKDGPRNDAYEDAKPLAWDALRAAVDALDGAS